MSSPLPVRKIAAIAVALLLTFGGASGRAFGRSGAAPTRMRALGRVTFIQRGLQVNPPHAKPEPGRVKMPLFQAYGLHTGSNEHAAIAFHDGTAVHLGQDTSVVLKSQTVTAVRRGQVDEILAPGADHRIETRAAIAAAIGTNFLVRIVGDGSYFMVIHGAVLVSNAEGSELVKARQGTFVVNGQAPEPAYPVNTVQASAWSDTMPTPDLGENVALDGAGGRVVASSSQQSSPSGQYVPANIIDGDLTTGWESATGATANQWIKLALAGKRPHHLFEVLVDPASQDPSDPAAALRSFQVRVSTTGTTDADFRTILRATCTSGRNRLERFHLPTVTAARYVELFAVSNRGSTAHVAVTEFEAVARD